MIAIGSDHGGFELKGHIIEHFGKRKRVSKLKTSEHTVRQALIIQTVQSLYARLFLTVNVNAVYLSAVQV